MRIFLIILCAFANIYSALHAKPGGSLISNAIWGSGHANESPNLGDTPKETADEGASELNEDIADPPDPLSDLDDPTREDEPQEASPLRVNPASTPTQARQKNPINISEDSSHALVVTEGFAAPSDDYAEQSINETDEVDADLDAGIDEDIDHLSARIERDFEQGSGQSYSLAEAFQAVLKSPQAQVLRSDAQSADADARIALASLLPDLKAGYSYSRFERRNVESKDEKHYEQESNNLKLTASYTVFNGLSGYNGKRASDFYSKASHVAVQEGLSKLLLETVKAFSGALAARNLILAYERRVALANEALKVALSRYRVGDMTRSDLKTSRSALSKARSELAKARADNVKALTSLENLVDMELDDMHLTPITLPGDFPDDFEECRKIALANNFTIRKADLQITALDYQRKAAYGRLSPSVSVYATAARDFGRRWNNTEHIPEFTPTVELNAGVNVEIPIDYKKSITSEARKRVYSLEKEKARQRFTRLNIMLEVKKIWSEFEGTEKSIKHLESQVKASSEAWKALREGFAQGSKISVELLQAERDYIAAEVDLIRTRQERLVQGFTLLHTIGNLSADVLDSTCPFQGPGACVDDMQENNEEKKQANNTTVEGDKNEQVSQG